VYYQTQNIKVMDLLNVSALSNEQLNCLRAKVNAQMVASVTNDKIRWNVLFEIKQDLEKEISVRSAAMKNEIMADLLGIISAV
jgi:hypothetical protein